MSLHLASLAFLHLVGVEDKKTDLEGEWTQTGYENFGKFNKIPDAEQGTYTFAEGKLSIRVPSPKIAKDGTSYKIGGKEQTLRCIYELKDDTLRIVQPYDVPEGARPPSRCSSTTRRRAPSRRSRRSRRCRTSSKARVIARIWRYVLRYAQ